MKTQTAIEALGMKIFFGFSEVQLTVERQTLAAMSGFHAFLDAAA